MCGFTYVGCKYVDHVSKQKKNCNKTYQYFLWIFLYGLINALVDQELSYLLFGSENIKLTAAFENFDNI